MSLSDILERIRVLLLRFFPGNQAGTYPNGNAIINRFVVFISTHPLILFFVLVSFLFVAIRILRRMINL